MPTSSTIGACTTARSTSLASDGGAASAPLMSRSTSSANATAAIAPHAMAKTTRLRGSGSHRSISRTANSTMRNGTTATTMPISEAAAPSALRK